MLKQAALLTALLTCFVLAVACGGASMEPAGGVLETTSQSSSATPTDSSPAEPPAAPAAAAEPKLQRLNLDRNTGSSRDNDTLADPGPPAVATQKSATADTAETDPAAHPESARDREITMRANPAAAKSQQESNLAAGETDDNQQWNSYLNYLQEYYPSHEHSKPHRREVSNRLILRITDSQGAPIPGVKLQLSSPTNPALKGTTYADGRAIFMPTEPLNNNSVLTATYNDRASEHPVQNTAPATWKLTLQDITRQAPPQTPLDVMFLLDSTGSMDDEIAKLKSTLLSIAKQVNNLPANPDLRFAMVTYRDRDDDYTTELFDFESDPETFLETIRNIYAEGGGDTPESLNEALQVALNKASWRSHPDTVRLVFLIADAPPHLDYP